MTKPALALAFAVAALATLCAPAQANQVQCGDVITQDTTLDSDLLNCPGDGIVIGADSITLDLNGHLVDGTGFPTTGVGIDNNAGHDGVTVIHGQIREFRMGVRLTNADANMITGLNVFESGNNMVSVHGDSDQNVISRNVGEGQIGLVGDTDANLIERNTLTMDFGTAVAVFSADPPESPDRNRIERNTISIPFQGIEVSGAFDTTVARNTVSGAALGIVSAGVRTRIIRNTVLDSLENGIVVGGETDGELVGNDLVGSGDDGIIVGLVAVRTRLDQNTANRSDDDGIDVRSASTTLTKNTANDNGDLGIEAVSGVTDGGGNEARGNANPAQCVNVSCK